MLAFIKFLNNILWGYPMIILLLGIHIYFSFKLNFIQKYIFKAIKLSVSKVESSSTTALKTLTTNLAATLGTGNIIGVSTAIALGGPGALFWCWITGILGMATSYAECYLSIIFRIYDNKRHEYIGGPMYVLRNGLNNKFLAFIFSTCTILASFGVGCTTQSNAISNSITNNLPISPHIIGLICAILVGFVIIGGFNSIGAICMKLVPSMALFYTIGCILLLCFNKNYIFTSLSLIFKSAFSAKQILSGFVGASLNKAIRYGVSRGLFTNEAGLGSTPITASLANSHTPSQQSLISMTATFWDTVVMCPITGITIITTFLSNNYTTAKIPPTDLITISFNTIPYIGNIFLSISLIAFAFATLIGWFTFGERSWIYIFKNKYLDIYKISYIVMVYLGAIISLDLVWEMCDFFNALMAIPNIISLKGTVPGYQISILANTS